MKTGQAVPLAFRSTVAYLLCLGILPIALLIFPVLRDVLHIAPRPSDAGSASIASLIGTLGFIFVIVYIVGFFISVLPCVLLHLLAAHFRISNPVFYVVAGGLLGLFGFAIAILLPGHFSHVRPDTLHWYLTRLVSVSCAVGLVYWGVAGRYFRKQANELA